MELTDVDLEIDLSVVYEELDDRKDDILDVVVDTCKKHAPVSTGRLRNSIQKYSSNGTDAVVVDVPYAFYTEVRGSSAGWFSTAVSDAASKAAKIWKEGS